VNADELELGSTKKSLVKKYNQTPWMTKPQHMFYKVCGARGAVLFAAVCCCAVVLCAVCCLTLTDACMRVVCGVVCCV
jgi:hypothetical protein